jgi:predicted dehydrogenase
MTIVGGSSKSVRIGIVGAGAVSDYHHVPGIRLDRRAVLAGVCDASGELVEKRKKEWGIEFGATDPMTFVTDDRIDAVVIATPNDTHAPIAIAAAKSGKHVMCEKPLGLNATEVDQMHRACVENKVVHMTAFTYRFAPSMRYMADLVHSGKLGEVRHFRSQRFLDLPETSWGWRQYKERAGAGDLFDMTIHRIDLGVWLAGPLSMITGAVARFAPRDKTADGKPCRSSDVDDWSSLIGRFANGAVGVWEGTTLAKGYSLNGFGHEWCEINGSEGSAVYRLHRPNELWLGKTGSDLNPEKVPAAYLKPASSPRDPSQGAPATVFRYDLMWEFVSAIVEGRDASPSFRDGLIAQQIADAVLESDATNRWVTLPTP